MKTICVCIALVLAGGAVLANGAIASEKKITVRYGDLDISKPAGRDVFQERLTLAARRVCGPEPGMARRLHEGPAYETCLKSTMQSAVAALPRKIAAKLGETALVTEARLN